MPTRNQKISGRPEDSMDRPDAMRSKPQSSLTMTPGGPEWKSERWKREVEAEARRRLKKQIREIGSKR
jgi:hypothetical protein